MNRDFTREIIVAIASELCVSDCDKPAELALYQRARAAAIGELNLHDGHPDYGRARILFDLYVGNLRQIFTWIADPNAPLGVVNAAQYRACRWLDDLLLLEVVAH